MKKQLVCYYAHPMPTYNSLIEKEDIKLLNDLGFEVFNPNTEEIQKACNTYVKLHGKENVMTFFEKLILEHCSVVAFRALPNGDILSGVASEVDVALKNYIPVIELPRRIKERSMDYPSTKRYLIESGFYKVNND